MPPRKRTRKASPASPPSSPHSPSPDDATDGDTSVDPALLDEEEGSASDTDGSIPPARARGAGGYNALKTHEDGTIYTGMAIGGRHTWTYAPGTWRETKTSPDRWTIDYRTTKHRTRRAPTGTGAPVGTQYHWLLIAHQYVEKLDANTYATRLSGTKYKLAHRGAGRREWSVPTVKAQREREVALLEDAKQRVQGLPPVTPGERVREGELTREKGQMRVDVLFKRQKTKRKREEGEDADADGEF
ncbi:hypothetical protein VTN02DRAFT_968 [Thermoascus thermophilus]